MKICVLSESDIFGEEDIIENKTRSYKYNF